ncbi:MAG: glycosyltransferase [Pseudobutyrivibrio ruminis]|uniref:glycosyltransferase n=1 Tax=Pseudobutyrivibrio ruminis TaxID=46206 RepID=UPI0026EFB3C0|nr:glycosyltransferase [Pseudobutyrivibrio ruminis]MBE5912925.1 glycosyltransferase [Pseudobutyrivibrio ruminis]
MNKHTFVICAYGESQFLEECITSVLNQTEKSNVILATSTPNEHINDLCKKNNIPLFINDGETGITQDWMYAISCAKTPLVTIAHQDDIYFENYAKKAVEAFEESSKPLIFFTDYWEIRNDIYVKSNKLLNIKRVMLLPLRIKALQGSKWVRRRILSLGSPICCPSVSYAVDNLPSPLFLNHFRTNEDWEAWERYSWLEGDFLYCKEPLMAHRIHADSETTATIQETGRSAEDYEMYRKFWPEKIAKFLVKKYKESEKSNQL